MTHPLLDEHEQLREVLLGLERMIEGPASGTDLGAWVASLAERLRHATAEVVRHFAWEANTGLFTQIESALPEASAQCEALMAEHDAIGADLARLSARLEKGPDEAGLRLLLRELGGVLERLHRHEEHENQLLLDAVEIEIAAQD